MQKTYTLFDGRAVPNEGARMIPVALNFFGGDSFSLDVGQVVSLNRISGIQSVIVCGDRVGSNVGLLSIQIPRTDQILNFQYGTSYAHLPVPNPATMIFTPAIPTAYPATVWLCNFPLPSYAVFNANFT